MQPAGSVPKRLDPLDLGDPDLKSGVGAVPNPNEPERTGQAARL
jgi:hypothetical protein